MGMGKKKPGGFYAELRSAISEVGHKDFARTKGS